MRQLYLPIKVWTTLFLFYCAAILILFFMIYSVFCFLLYLCERDFDYKYFSWFYCRKLRSLSIRCDFTINVHKYYYLFILVLRTYYNFSKSCSYYCLLFFSLSCEGVNPSVWRLSHFGWVLIIFYYKNIF